MFNKDGKLEKALGTVIEVTVDGEATTTRATYKYMKGEYYGTF
jgi:hypothetical protein